MSQRRVNTVCGKSRFTIFVTGFRSRSLPVLVTDHTTVADIYHYLMSIGIVPSGLQQLYFTHLGRRVAWADNWVHWVWGHCLICICVFVSREAQMKPGPSRPVRTRNPEREQLMKDVYNEEKLDEFGNVKKPTRTTVKRKRKEKPVNTDSEDNDFRGNSDSSTDDSEIEDVIANDEVAASLPTHTLPKNASRKGKAPEKKRAKRTQNDSPAPSASTSTATVNTTTASSTPTASTSTNPGPPPPIPAPKKRKGGGKKTLAIYLFFEEVDSPANGVAVEGSQYFKCWLGNRGTIEIPSTARHNVSSSAVAVERIFSGGRDTTGLRRASLKAETIQTLMFVKARLRCARAALEREEKIISI
ncbi:hypothetical protein DFH08DRAFT_940207 [Mycena albidolilacea]|uniref:HAT C-terminal dimerisation domain-containing protein n=1 Tax=Mycena albidolilacea TaxID=1033008 RepID=A0AAD6ZNC1_9AGAR|nr:hypothetical protein DFH08DRAFT_940207 [Mycena albidolilacea]